MMKILIVVLAIFLQAEAQSSNAPCVSALWGSSGEVWRADARLSDFSSAGYAEGRKELPDYPVRVSVKDHGAKGDGITDDTAAFREALRNVGEKGAVFIPAGRYLITDVVEIKRSGVVLRGEGPDKSVLVFSRPLSAIHPRANVDDFKSAYSFSGGFLSMKGSDIGVKLGDVTGVAKRGDTTLTLSSTNIPKPGERIRLIMNDPPDHSLLRHLHADLLEPGIDTPNLKRAVDWAATVRAVKGRVITLDCPLRVNIRPEWKPEIFLLSPTLLGSGIENLGMEFPGMPKQPHLQEEGYNAIELKGAVDCWIRNVTVTDADNGVILGGCRFCTVDGVKVRAAKRTGLTGHHALWATGRTQDSLFVRFRFDTTYVHDLSVEGFANGNVFASGSGVAINCDHHRNAPYDNLFTDIDVGDPRRLFESSGREDRGPHSGARTTFWCIHGNGKYPPLPPAKDWPLINVIGFGDYSPLQDPVGPWVEPGNGHLLPRNLWEAQVRHLRKTTSLTGQ
jgi:Pectate lyase superfamily protein